MTEEKKNESGGNEPMTRQKFESEIILKAWKDPEYKKRLLESPKEVMQEELRKIRPELTLPEELQVYIHEETPNAVHMTLPAPPADGELSDEAWLDSVSGGFIGVRVAFAVTVAAAAAANAATVVNAVAAANAVVAANAVSVSNAVAGANVVVNANVAVNVNVNK